jgi:hypothetical protein
MEKLKVSKQRSSRFYMETFNLKKLNEVNSYMFAALENVDTAMNINTL